MKHFRPGVDPEKLDPLDYEVKGIFFVLLPVSAVIVSLFLMTIGIHMVIT